MSSKVDIDYSQAPGTELMPQLENFVSKFQVMTIPKVQDNEESKNF